jgi:hypothetical protein
MDRTNQTHCLIWDTHERVPWGAVGGPSNLEIFPTDCDWRVGAVAATPPNFRMHNCINVHDHGKALKLIHVGRSASEIRPGSSSIAPVKGTECLAPPAARFALFDKSPPDNIRLEGDTINHGKYVVK